MTRTFSRVFPKGHIHEGKQTFFVEQILNHLGVDYISDKYLSKLLRLNYKALDGHKLTYEEIEIFYLSLQQTEGKKLHTIRGGQHFKAGDLLSPRVWFGRPYNSPQLIFWDDLLIKKEYDFEIKKEIGCIAVGGFLVNADQIKEIALNDGLTLDSFKSWFGEKNGMYNLYRDFNGQIICWGNVDY